MKTNEISIRDPYILFKDGAYYLYGTRAYNFGAGVGGFDVYVSSDLENWSEPIQCFDSEKYGLNRDVNWAPEVHEFRGKYYAFVTFTQPNNMRATYSLVSDSLTGPFVPCGTDPLTPKDWFSLDGTLYVDPDGVPYLVFCHEHEQISDGTICYVQLNEDLSAPVGEVVTLFSAKESGWADPYGPENHHITDGPFMHRREDGELYMIWSTFIEGRYAVCLVKFKDGKLGMDFEHLKPLLDSDGGHGMIFSDESHRYLTYHAPNILGQEHPYFCYLETSGDTFNLVER